MRVNSAGAGHAGPVKNGVAEWKPYTAALSSQQRVLTRAIAILQNNVRGVRPCNNCFSRLPGGRNFDAIFGDNNVWISYCPDNSSYGFTNRVGGSEITICELAFRWGVWTVAGTLVHEMAHVNGASAATHDAEATLPPCGFGKVYDPLIIGTRETPPIYIA